MQTKRIFSTFAFTLLTIFLLLVVASRSSEAAKADSGIGNVDASINTVAEPSAKPSVLPGGKEELADKAESKPDIDISSWEYILADSDNNIGTYTPPHVTTIENTAQYFDDRAIGALTEFLTAARAAGYSPYIQNAYRSYQSQNYIYNGRASQIAWPEYPTAEDYAEAAKYVAEPGTSDHQTGLGVDITDRYYSSLDASKMDQDFLAWLRENCAKYGFILRYPAAKESITGWNEPWHFRYVGVEAATYIMDNNLCLEQFVALYK